MKQMMLLAVAAAFLGGCASVASESTAVAPPAEPVVAEPVVTAAPVLEIPATATEAVQTQGEVAAQSAVRGQGAAQGDFSMTIRASGKMQSDAAFDANAQAQGAAEGHTQPAR